MNAEQKAPLDGYQQAIGTKKLWVGEVAGMASYATGGQTINAIDLGLGGIDIADIQGISYSGTYFGRVQYLPVVAPPSTQKGACTQIKVVWVVVATGAEVANTTNLSGEIMRLLAIGV